MARTKPESLAGNTRSVKHGIDAFRTRGPGRLQDPASIERYSELKRLLATQPGREDLRIELGARAFLLVEMGFSELHRVYETGGDLWESPVIRRYATFLAECRRILSDWPDSEQALESANVIMDMLNNDKDS